ncbi:MAG: nuclease-related domain-containing protein [Hespellia sp.]|nr:nuclease-related domain-containing protein [Hespellia sp.]
MSVWSEVVIGIALVAGTYWVIKTAYQWNRFRRSAYIELYSSYIEYAFRKKNIVKLSESFYLKNEFGKHRIFYQIAQAKNEKKPQAYILLLLSTGIYILNVKNQADKIILKQHGDMKQIYMEKQKKGEPVKEHQYLFKNPMEESRFFAKRMEQRIGNTEIPVKSIVVFPEKSELTWDGQPDMEVPVIKRKELIATIKADMEKSQTVLKDSQIDDLYYQLAKESIEMEKNM